MVSARTQVGTRSDTGYLSSRKLALWPIAGLLVLTGACLAAGGAILAFLGGSLYYLPTGIACIVSGVLIGRGNRLGARLYYAIFAATAIWALAEAGLRFWLLMPRVAGPLLILLYLLLPAVQRHLGAVRSVAVWRWAAASAVALFLGIALFLYEDYDRFSAESGIAEPLAVGAATPTRWADYAGNKAGTRFSPASQITAANVSELKPAWTYRTGEMPKPGMPQMFQATPLQIDDTLYLCTPHNVVIALDADTGKERWRYDPKVDASGVYTITCRGVSYHEVVGTNGGECARRVIVSTIDGRMIAVDAVNGRPCRSFGTGGQVSLRIGMGTVKGGFQFVTSPATIIGNVAVVGGFVLDNMGTDSPSGVVRGYDVSTGKLLWVWDAGRADPGHLLKPGETYVSASPNAWSLFSADEQLGMVYIPTGNPSPDYFGGQRSAEMERYGSSVVALDAATGKLRWSFQTVHHDLWDYDVASQPVLFDMPMGGKVVPALVQATKQGEIFLLDRRTGLPLAPVDELPVPLGNVPGERYSLTQPVSRAFPSLVPQEMREADMWGATPLDQLWCRVAFRRLAYQGRFTPPSLDDSLIFPGNNGIMNWGSLAIDPVRNIMVVPTSYMPMKLRLIPRDSAPKADQIVLEGRGAISPMKGTPYAVRTERPFVSPLGIPCNAPPWGRLTAIDLRTRQILWQRPLGTTRDHAPLSLAVPGVFNQGGAMVTAGGLAFIGATLDDYLRAFDVTTGREAWKTRLPAGGQALPMSYVSPKSGRQYVVIAAGGHGFMDTTLGDFVVAYSIAGNSGP